MSQVQLEKRSPRKWISFNLRTVRIVLNWRYWQTLDDATQTTIVQNAIEAHRTATGWVPPTSSQLSKQTDDDDAFGI